MGFSLVASYSLWFILLCLLAGSVYAILFYYREKNGDFNKTTTIALALIRGTVISFIAFLLLAPLIKSTDRHSEKPIVLLAVDNSESVAMGKDSAYIKGEFSQAFSALGKTLSSDYDVKIYTFGDKLKSDGSIDFTEKLSDYSSLFDEIRNEYSNRNLAALILAGDGIYNQGADPLYASDNAPYSIYTVALGDTNQQKDIVVKRVNYNRVAYLGNDFPVEITVNAFGSAGSRSKISVSSGDQQLFTADIVVDGERYSRTFNVRVSATKPGVQKFRIAVAPVSGEISRENNYQDIYVEVLDSRQKILLLYSSPHPDVAAVKQSLGKNSNYAVEEMAADDFNGSVDNYSLVILHQIPSLTNAGFQVLNQLKTSKVPVLYILGSQSAIPAYNNLMSGLQIAPSSAAFNEATAIVNNSFSLFSLAPDVVEIIPGFPPLSVPFSQYKPSTGTQVLCYQKIGNVSTSIPLILFNQGTERKTATISGEGIWQWRMANYVKAGNQLAFDELLSRIIQYLAAREDKSPFRILHQNNFIENESVELDAELYNDSYQLVNDPDVNVVISDEQNINYPFAFTRTSNAYYLNAGSLPPGEYTYKASTTFAGKPLQKTGKFSIRNLNVEAMNTVADHLLLNNIAKRHNGQMVYPGSMNEIISMLKQREDVKTVVYSQKRYSELTGYLPALILIILLLTTEWFLRKRNGSY